MIRHSPSVLRRSLLAFGFIALFAPLALACDVSAVINAALGGTPTAAPLPTQVPIATLAPLPTNAPQPANVVTNAVMAQDASANTFDPIGITNSFPANQSIFHAVVTIANAPDNTSFKVVWRDSANNQMASYQLSSSGSRNLDFTFKPNAGTLPAGNYQVELYVNGALNQTLKFSVASAAQAQPTTRSPQPSGVIASVTMAEDAKADTKEPINPTVVFKPSSTFHAIVAIQNAPANTKFGATWYTVDVGSAAPPNNKIDSTELTTDGSRNIDFTLQPNTTWPVGTYRVEITVNGVLDTVKTFSVQ